LSIGPVIVRLHGVDAPEAGQQCRRTNGRSWQCGTEAANRLAELADGKQVNCEALDRDAYGRIVAKCWRHETALGGALNNKGLA
jgi:endonuclease YncB( thermonuclease family)